MSNAQGYTRAQITLHWITAILVIASFVTHEAMIAATEAVEEGTYAGYDAAMLIHTIGGSAVFLFALWRLGLLSRRGAPALPEDEPALLRLSAVVVKITLYAIMLVMPVTGVLNWFGGVAVALQIHQLMEPVILAAFALHVLGALYQHFWLKSGVLARMIRPAPEG